MPQIGRMEKIVLYDQPIIDEKLAAIVDVQTNYSTWSPSQNHLQPDKSDFYSDDDVHKILVPGYNEYFRRQSVNLEWRNISLKTPEGKKILNGMNGSTRSGELTAIMGPSGAGKTSLLNVLTGFVQKNVSGHVYVNGIKRNMKIFRQLTCYILQDSKMLEVFTVRELVTIASRLKLPTSLPEKERKKIVEDCIYSFGLDAFKNQKANTLSGGQKKRLYIAQEIVNNPPLIFLDEPTSGLDSSSSLQCMQLLKSFAMEGRNVICSIHQPSSRIYETFDNMYMVSEGQCIFRGPTKSLIPFLENQGLKCPLYHSATDFITDIAIGAYGDWNWKLRNSIDSVDEIKNRWYEKDCTNSNYPDSRCWQLSSLFSLFRKKVKDATEEENWTDKKFSSNATGFWNQFNVLLSRSFLNIIKEPKALFAKLISSVSLGLLFGCLFYDTGNDGSLILNTSAFMFTLMIYVIITAKIPTIITFPTEREIFERERMNCWYDTPAYFFAKTTASVPFQILYPTITCTIVYWMSGQPQEFSRFSKFLLTAYMLGLTGESIGLLLGAAFSMENALYLGGVVTCPMMVLCGGILPITDIPVYLRWMSDVTYMRYGLNSLFKVIYLDRQPMECSKKICFSDASFALKYKRIEGDLSSDWLAILGYLLLLRTAVFCVLYLKTSQRR